jgi:hypothetical protein
MIPGLLQPGERQFPLAEGRPRFETAVKGDPSVRGRACHGIALDRRLEPWHGFGFIYNLLFFRRVSSSTDVETDSGSRRGQS